jgi:hypothetical protein
MTGRRTWLPVLIVGLLLLGFALKGVLLIPPSPPATAEAGHFDTGRALARLERILGDQRPHSVDSDANDAVRERLIAEIRAIGLEPRIQEASDCSAMPKSRAVSCSRVRNVIATVGSGPGKHVLLNSHYDSTPAGPGAADDGVGVASMLEIAAILQKSPPTRPVSFLFNEGEEFGLNGASAFVREDPLADDVDALINIESRGVSGPAIMFETSDPNAAAIAAYARASERPYANSLSMDFAKLIPNTTDVVEFRPAGWTILNYAIIGNETRYHTPGDTIAALDRASLYHVGSEALAATQVMASTKNLATAKAATSVFTDVGGRLFLRLWLPTAAVAFDLLLLLALVQAIRRKALGKPMLVAAGAVAGGIAVSVLVGIGAGFLRAGDFWRAYPLVTHLAVYATLLLVMAAFWRRWGGDMDVWRMRSAAWLLILLFGGIASIFLPGALIYFLIAPAIAVAGIMLAGRTPRAAKAMMFGAATIQFLMFGQLLGLIELLLIDGPSYAVAPLASLAALPIIVELAAPDLKPAVRILAISTVALWAAALLLPRASAERPAAFTIDYFRDDSQGEAHWTVASKQAPLPGAFPGEWKRGVPAYSARTRWISPAPQLEVPRPNIRFVKSEPAGKGRRIWLILSPGGANAVSIRIHEGTKLLRLGTPGATIAMPAEGEPEKALLRCSGRSCEGLVIEALLGDQAKVTADLAATRFSLPPEGAPLAVRRPAHAHPQYGADSSIRMRTVRF